MRISWDTDKDAANRRKHGLSFEVASRVFLDPGRIEMYDDREDYGEDRWMTIGAVNAVLLVVAYTVREDDGGEVIRLISARKANAPEKKRIVTVKLDAAKPRPLTRKQQAELAALARKPDREIDYSEIARIPASLLDRAVRAGLYRPVKRQLSVRIDADVLAWLKSHGKGYHSRLNAILRNAMLEERKSSS